MYIFGKELWFFDVTNEEIKNQMQFKVGDIPMGCKYVVIIFGYLFPIFFVNIVIIPIH